MGKLILICLAALIAVAIAKPYGYGGYGGSVHQSHVSTSYGSPLGMWGGYGYPGGMVGHSISTHSVGHHAYPHYGYGLMGMYHGGHGYGGFGYGLVG